MKEFAHAFSCAYIELWMHLGSLESTQEARVALGYRLVQLLRIRADKGWAVKRARPSKKV